MSDGRNVYQHVLDAVQAGAEPGEVQVDGLLPANITTIMAVRWARGGGDFPIWDTSTFTDEVRASGQWADGMGARRYHSAMTVDDADGGDSLFYQQRSALHRMQSTTYALDRNGRRYRTIQFNSGDPRRLHEVLDVDTIDDAVVFVFLQPPGESAAHCRINYSDMLNADVWVSRGDRVNEWESMLADMGITDEHQLEPGRWGEVAGVDDEAIDIKVWVAPDDWSYWPGMSRQVVFCNVYPDRPYTIAQNAFDHAVLDVSGPDAPDVSDEDREAAIQVIRFRDQAALAVTARRQGVLDRIADSQHRVTTQRDHAQQLLDQYQTALSAVREHARLRDEARAELANVDLSTIMDLFDLPAMFDNVDHIEDVTISGTTVHVKTKQLAVKGAVGITPCSNHGRFGDVSCPDCFRDYVRTVELGPFDITINTSTGSLSVQSDGVLSDDGYAHMHVSGGEVCWGSVGPAISDARARQDWASMIHITCGVLAVYNDDSPHCHIENFPETDRDPGWF